MTNSNAAAMAKSLGKRAVVPEETAAAAENLLNLSSQHHLIASSSNPPQIPTNDNRSIVQYVQNAAPSPHFSYVGLLNGTCDALLEEEEEEEENCPIDRDVEDQTNQINQMITNHNESLRESVLGMLEQHNLTLNCAAEDRATKRLKVMDTRLQEKIEQNAELERMALHYKAEAERVQSRITQLEQMSVTLSASLHATNTARRLATEAAEDQEGESSFGDPDKVAPVVLDCKVCHRKMATVMLWSCKHFCICPTCEAKTKYCPVCRRIPTTSVVFRLP